MCSWGHAAKNSSACSHEWRTRSNVALIFSTNAWHEGRGGKKKKKKKGHLLATAVNVRAWYKVPLTLVGETAGMSPGLWPCLVQPTEPTAFIFEQFAGKCHMERVVHTWCCPVFSSTPLHTWVKLQLPLHDTKAASRSTWPEPWII